MRQHSTPVWIRRLQEVGLDRLAEGARTGGLPSFETQQAVWNHFRRELRRLKRGEIPLDELVVARRTTRALADYRVKNTTYAALMRANERGCEVPPGGKVRYVVVDRSSEAVLDRVRLAEELEEVPAGVTGCSAHYGELAERAIWALLAPFGWTTEQLRQDVHQPNLLAFTVQGGAEQELQRPSPSRED